MREEADHLVELFAACDRVLPDLGENTDELKAAIRETCEAVERRLGGTRRRAGCPVRPKPLSALPRLLLL
jgi:hypothetical protein